MRHLPGLLLLVAASVLYAASYGPLFFGIPLLGAVLFGAGVVMETVSWRRLARAPHRHVR